MTREQMMENVNKMYGADSDHAKWFAQFMPLEDNDWNNACISVSYNYLMDLYETKYKKS